ncbi:MAG: hypothetical protein U0359_40265 [Byssovorax sp.]
MLPDRGERWRGEPEQAGGRALFGVDLRSLAAFRVGLGVAILVDLATRAVDLEAHYTDAGIAPRALPTHVGRLAAPLYRLSGGAGAATALFCFAAAVGLALLAGYRTRLSAFLSWGMLLSLHERNPLILSGGDPLLRIMLFWGMFLPLGAHWSIDSVRAADPHPPPPAGRGADRRVSSLAVTALVVQIASVYVFGGLFKLESPVWRDGRAFRFALAGYHMTTSMGARLFEHPRLCEALNHVVVHLEVFGGLLLLAPVKMERLRLLTLLAFAGLQAGIASCLWIGNFQPHAVLLTVPLLPPCLWDRLLPRLAGARLRAASARVQGWLGRRVGGGRPARALCPTLHDRALDRIAGGLGLYVLVCNVWSLFVPNDDRRLERFRMLAFAVGIDQRWDMFATIGPGRTVGWLLAPARLEDGDVADLFVGGGPPRWVKPALPSSEYKSWRWLRYTTAYVWPRSSVTEGVQHRARYASHLCRSWNARHRGGERALSIELFWMRQRVTDTLELSPPQKIFLGRLRCGEEESSGLLGLPER